MIPYIGITGIVNTVDTITVERCVPLVPPSHRLMAGVLVSAKTLRGEAPTSRRYPPFRDVEATLRTLAMTGAWPVVHFNTRDNLTFNLGALCASLPSMRGLQLNVAQFPTRDELAAVREMRPDVEVILQYRGADTSDLYALGARLRPFAGLADVVLVDGSQGTGKPLLAGDAHLAVNVWLNDAPEGIGLALAGGFAPESGTMLRRLWTGIGSPLMACLSFDAESGVRVPVDDPTHGEKHQDRLCRTRALAWVELVASCVRGAT